MSKLENLEKNLYDKKEDAELVKRGEHHEFSRDQEEQSPPRQWGEESTPPQASREAIISRKTLIKYIVAGFIVLFVAMGSLALFLYLGSGGQEARIAIFGRSPIESGEIVTIPITLKNASKSPLREAEVSVVFPESSLLIEDGAEREVPPRYAKKLDDFAPGEERTLQIKTRMFGYEGEEKKIEVVLLYRPENLGARFSAKASQVFVVGRVPLALAWDMPKLLSSGQEVLINLRYTSSAKAEFGNMSLRMNYPPGFKFVSSSPQPDTGEDIWKIGTFEPGEEGEIHIRGSVSGEEGEVKPFRAELGVYNELTKEWKPYNESVSEAAIAVSPLAVQGMYDESRDKIVEPGSQLSFTVRYKNNTLYTIKNVSLRASLEETPQTSKERVLEFASLQIDKNGVFDGTTHAIVWGPGSTPELREVKPGAEGIFAFRVKTKERPVIRNVADSNITLALKSKIEAAGVPKELAGTRVSAEDSVFFKVNTKVLFTGRSLYRASPIPNNGPLPPKVGSKTTYTIAWEVKDFTNTVENAEIRATLPPNIKWENKISPSDARITFDPASSDVRWRIGTLKAGTGILTPTMVGAFQVSLTPAEADVGDSLVLVSESKFTGTDSFTESTVEEKMSRFTTELREDSLTSTEDWRVVR
ncbi:MAG: hypothetical protein HYT37_04450 [Candidatus Sungbacteria bacterium]|nr:hypothetical protein [Candidatus Sungbacteria bacterium]